MKRSNSADVLSRWATSSATASYPVAIAARHVQNKSRNLTGPFVVADVITGTSKAMLAPKGTLLDTRTATQDAHFTYRNPLPNDGRPVINGSVGVARFSELVDTEGDRCLPKGAAPRRHTAAAYEAEYAVLSKRLMSYRRQRRPGLSRRLSPTRCRCRRRRARSARRRGATTTTRRGCSATARARRRAVLRARGQGAPPTRSGRRRASSMMSYASTFSRTPARSGDG